MPSATAPIIAPSALPSAWRRVLLFDERQAGRQNGRKGEEQTTEPASNASVTIPAATDTPNPNANLTARSRG